MRTNTSPTKPADPTVRCQELGDELLRLRKAAHLSVRHVAHMTCIDQSIVTRFEKGHRPPTAKQLGSLLTAYRADRPTRQRIEALAEAASQPDWWQRDRKEPTERQHTLVSLEAKADRLVNFEPMLVPGLLQTGEYTRALMQEMDIVPSDELEERMAARFCRQSVLEQRDPPELLALIDELALHRVVGGPAVMQRQLDYLVDCARKTHITVRIVPGRRGHAGVDGPFELIEMPERSPVVFIAHADSDLFVESRDKVALYERIVQMLLARALDGPQSVECVAKLATRLDTEESADGFVEPEQPDMAQEQLQRFQSKRLC